MTKRITSGLLLGVALSLALGTAVRGEEPQPKGWLDMAVADTGTAPQTTPTSQTVSAPAPEAPASPAWPPGLLMDGLDACSLKKPLDTLGIRMWGFAEGSYTGVLTNGQHTIFGRVFDMNRANNPQFNQFRFTIERPYDSAKSFDIGGRFDLLYGSDGRFTKAFPNEYAALENIGAGKGANWLDIVQGYGQAWVKTGKESGLEVTVGKWVTPFGTEVIDATGNALFSHSYLFNYAIPFTHTGVKANYIIDSHLSAYFAVVNGWDWFEDNNHAHSYMAGGAWCGTEQINGHARDTVYVNFITGPEQQDNIRNYRTVVDASYVHWWTKECSSTLNGDWGTEEKASAGGNRANWYGLAHYLTYVFNDYVTGTWRAEWFADDKGVRIGMAGNYVENTFGVTITPWPEHKILKNLSFRPELRWDASSEQVFGSDHNELTAAGDVIFKF